MLTIGMKTVYKDALRKFYQEKFLPEKAIKTYGSELFHGQYQALSYREPSEIEDPQEVSITRTKEEVEDTQQVDVPLSITEKAKVLDSLNVFTKELGENSLGDDIIPIEGGEIQVKKKSDGHRFDVFRILDRLALIEFVKENSSERGQLARLKEDKNSPLKVIFVTDEFMIDVQETEDQNLSEFFELFEESTALLFSKMVQAMNLTTSQFYLTANKFEGEDYFDVLLSEIYYFKPELIITLGAKSSHRLLNIKDRLQEIHGKIYNLSLKDFDTAVMPLFSPNLLNTAPNMKKIAWSDMQMAMKRLGL